MTNTTAATGTRSGEPEQTLWEGRPSQWINFGAFVVGGVGVAAPIVGAVLLAQPLVALASAVFVATTFWKWLQVRCTQFTVTSERIKVRRGVLSRERHELELYRIKDTALDEPFLLRLVSRANVRVVSSDKTHPVLLLPAIAAGDELREQIRRHVERLRERRRVREIDFE